MDLAMWETFLKQWNGHTFFLEENVTCASDISLYTDASSTIGYGGYYYGEWFQGKWPPEIQDLGDDTLSMALLELYPIVVAAVIWGHKWSGKRIKFWCDNLATVQIIKKRRSKSPMIMKLLRKLTWISANNNFLVLCDHVPGKINIIADSLSRFQMKIQGSSSSSSSNASTSTILERINPVLEKESRDLCESSISDNTRRAYRTGFTVYCQFLSSIGIEATNYNPPKISEQTLIYFVTHCCNSLKLTYNTIKLYLAAVRFHYVKAGISNPLSSDESCARLQTVLRGIQKQQSSKQKRRPITYSVLIQIQNVLQRGMFSYFLDTMLQAACSLAFFAFLRCGEFTMNDINQDNLLCVEDVVMDQNYKAYTITLKRSKTDPFRKGIQIRLFQSDQTVCPVKSMLKYLNLRRKWYNCVMSSALFMDESGNPLSRHFLITKLQQILKSLGLDDENFNGHSFRIGAATSAAGSQVEDHLIKTLGRWSSDCYTRYIRSNDQTLSRAQKAMCCQKTV
ncbi:uncharacterized protein LOC134229226 [Saccostrea cucullata]|uniref:uncharacterized protein LOC134229226 n=1 Tax=Saccostrea cuccullata TaxID=36930 RepID=UPI002ED588C9